MKITIQRVWNGRNLGFRIGLPGGGHEYEPGDRWNRVVARKVLNLLENVYGHKRRNVKFVHI